MRTCTFHSIIDDKTHTHRSKHVGLLVFIPTWDVPLSAVYVTNNQTSDKSHPTRFFPLFNTGIFSLLAFSCLENCSPPFGLEVWWSVLLQTMLACGTTTKRQCISDMKTIPDVAEEHTSTSVYLSTQNDKKGAQKSAFKL